MLGSIRDQTDWSKVSLYSSPSFLLKNQLIKEGREYVAIAVIPVVRALCCWLHRTSDLRQNKELVLYVSFKKGFDKDISPATISSLIKQTVLRILFPCCKIADQEALTLH